MTPRLTILHKIWDRGLINRRDDGVIVYETIIQKRYPSIDVYRLCDFLDVHDMDWNRVIAEYLG